MSDLRKAAEMALEALEWNYGTDLCDIENCTAWLDKMNATIPALRQALAESANSTTDFVEPKTPVQPEQEAFTLDRGCWERGCMAYDWRDGDGVNISAGRVDEMAKHKHEPVAWLSLCYTEDGDPLGYTAHEQEVYGSFPVYTTPPHHASDVKKREWVEITRGECDELFRQAADHVEYAWAVEALLKEKNT
jgi:hypothetical protein